MYLMPTLNVMATTQVWDVVLDKWGSIPPVLWMYVYETRGAPVRAAKGASVTLESPCVLFSLPLVRMCLQLEV
jgi:hypothetical protein